MSVPLVLGCQNLTQKIMDYDLLETYRGSADLRDRSLEFSAEIFAAEIRGAVRASDSLGAIERPRGLAEAAASFFAPERAGDSWTSYCPHG